MVTEAERQGVVDEEHLRFLSIAYWVWGGLVATYALFMSAYFAFIGALIVSTSSSEGAPPDAFLWIFLGVAGVVLVLVGALSVFQILTGFWIRKRTHRVASMVVAGFTCLSMPMGTLLGIFSFLVLSRKSVLGLYAPQESLGVAALAPSQDSAAGEVGDGPGSSASGV